MDETVLDITEAQFKIPLIIPDKAFVYRQVYKTQLDKVGRFPKAKHFMPDSDGLSTLWNEFATVKEVYHIIGISYKINKTVYKNPLEFSVFAFPIVFLKGIEGINEILHSPVFCGNPAPVGNPNNYAHASVCYGEDEQIRLNLSDYCSNKFDTAHCPIDFQTIESEVEALRLRLNNTKYHCCKK
jgi:hypothetical protein